MNKNTKKGETNRKMKTKLYTYLACKRLTKKRKKKLYFVQQLYEFCNLLCKEMTIKAAIKREADFIEITLQHHLDSQNKNKG